MHPKQMRTIATAVCLAVMMSGCGGGSNTKMDDGGMPGGGGIATDSWLFTGAVASQQARADGTAAINEIYQSSNEFEFAYATSGTTAEFALEEDPFAPFLWGYWSHADFAPAVTLFQAIRYDIPGEGDTERLVVAVMNHGYFGIGHTLELGAGPFSVARFGTSGFYAVDNSLDLGGSRDLRSLDLTGSAWTGDVLAIERHSQAGAGHLGIAELIVTDEINVGSVGDEYSVALNINLDNGRHFSMTGGAGGSTGLGNPSDIFVVTAGETVDGLSEYIARGTFAGPNAEEAFGAFEAPDYYGAFGLSRYSGN